MEPEHELRGHAFAVADRPRCLWGYDDRARTLEFLDALNPAYFAEIGTLLGAGLGADKELNASIALRLTYRHGIETLMSLLAAFAQAPAWVPAWIAACRTDELTNVVSRFRDRAEILALAGPRRLSFGDLSELVHRFVWTDESGDQGTASRFGRFWSRLGVEFLDGVACAEYNALKHGNRVSAGGFTLAIGQEDVYGEAAPPEAMRSMGGSKFGSTFFTVEPVGSSKHNIRTRRLSVNWSPAAMVQRLHLMSMSINNVVGALRCGLGVDPATVKFDRPVPLEAFDDVWACEPSVTHLSMDWSIAIDSSREPSKEALRQLLHPDL